MAANATSAVASATKATGELLSQTSEVVGNASNSAVANSAIASALSSNLSSQNQAQSTATVNKNTISVQQLLETPMGSTPVVESLPTIQLVNKNTGAVVSNNANVMASASRSPSANLANAS